MEYQVLTDENKRQMWEGTIARIEEQHYALVMQHHLVVSIMPKTGEAVSPDVIAHTKQLCEQIAIVEKQHAEAVRQRDAQMAIEETLHIVRDAREAVGD